MFLATESMRPFITKYKKLPVTVSDHDPIYITVDFTKFEKGKSYWKYSNALIKDPVYVHRIKNQIRLTLAKYVLIDGFVNFFEESSEYELQNFLNMNADFYFNLKYNINPHTLFEMILNDIRCESISYSAEKKRVNLIEEKDLKNKLQRAKNLSDLNPDNDLLYNNYKNRLDTFDSYTEKKVKQYILDHGISQKALGEKPTSFFLNLEKNNNAQKYINRLNVEKNGKKYVLNKQNEIEIEIKNYYQNLYSNKDENITFETIEEFMDNDRNNVEYIKLTTDEAKKLEGSILESELLEVLK